MGVAGMLPREERLPTCEKGMGQGEEVLDLEGTLVLCLI